MSRYFIDTEFIDDGKTIDLISIGIVCESGHELYLQSVEFHTNEASPWVMSNVIPHLKFCPNGGKEVHYSGKCNADCPWRTREQIRNEAYQFIHENGMGGHKFWGWCSAYDFVTLCQLFGTMMDLPPDWPHYMHDLQHVLDERGILDEELPVQEEGLHNALEDAKHIKKLWGYIVRNDAWQ